MECFSFPFEAMGSRCGIHLFAETQSEASVAATDAICEVKRIEAHFSRYHEGSETGRINRAAAAGVPISVDIETARLLNMAFRFHRMSDGLFDITSGVLRKAWDFSINVVPEEDQIRALLPLVGMRHLSWHHRTLEFDQPGMDLDFGGIAKEYAADKAAGICRAMGHRHTLVDLGGDLSIVGPLPDGSPWKIDIRNPRHSEDSFAVIEVSKGGVATSGDYERFIDVGGRKYCHILNPVSGFPVNAVASVTVVASSCRMAGGLSTSGMLMEDRAEKWLIAMNRPYAVVRNDGIAGGTLLRAA